MNIYEMYVHHWKKPGFWVRRTTWGNTIAKIIYVGEFSGRAPYYGNPEVRVDVYDIHTGVLKDKNFLIETAGTYKTWRWVQPPEWSGEPPFDPKAGRLILYVPFEKNKVASKMGARWSDFLGGWWIPEDDEMMVAKANSLGFMTPPPPPEPKVFFSIPYEQKSIANSVKAKFESALKLWSLPASDETGISTLGEVGFLPVEVPQENIED